MNRFLAARSEAERRRIRELTAEVADALGRWAAPHPVLEAVRFPAIAISMAAAAPWLPVPDLLEMAMIPAWIYAVDDAYDRGIFAPPERGARVRRYALVAAGHGAPEGDPYAAPLADLTARLRRRPLWPELGARWPEACRRMLAGMAFECDTADAVAAGAPPPSVAAYLGHGLHSIGVPLFLAGAWLVAGDAAPARDPAGFGRLARASGRAVRLANDLRTHEKETGERNFNILMLLGRGGLPQAAAEAEVRARLRAALGAVRRQGRRTGEGAAASLAVRVTEFSVDLYADYDYHTVPAEHVLRGPSDASPQNPTGGAR